MQQPNNPLHGVKLADIITFLAENIGWEKMANHVPVRCFQYDPSIKSSLAFLRKNQWARDKVEELYLETIKQPSKKASPDSTSAHGKYKKR